MSAWIVSKKHIDYLVSFIKEEELDPRSPDVIGAMLWAENYRSVNTRYSENDVPPTYRFEPFVLPENPIIVYKQFACYGYQTCETDDYEDTPSGKLVRKAETLLERVIFKQHPAWKGVKEKIYDDPTWNQAPWGIEDE